MSTKLVGLNGSAIFGKDVLSVLLQGSGVRRQETGDRGRGEGERIKTGDRRLETGAEGEVVFYWTVSPVQ